MNPFQSLMEPRQASVRAGVQHVHHLQDDDEPPPRSVVAAAHLLAAGKKRRVRILEALREEGRITARGLAALTGATMRTIYRDIAELQAYGLPIEGKSGDGYVWRGERI